MAWNKYCVEYWLKELQESMDRCTGHCHITEILLKTVLNTIQSINQFSQITFMVQRVNIFGDEKDERKCLLRKHYFDDLGH